MYTLSKPKLLNRLIFHGVTQQINGNIFECIATYTAVFYSTQPTMFSIHHHSHLAVVFNHGSTGSTETVQVVLDPHRKFVSMNNDRLFPKPLTFYNWSQFKTRWHDKFLQKTGTITLLL